ncbi:MAG TPA: hypothetical protein VF235_04255 [Actinomycetota bacterium]
MDQLARVVLALEEPDVAEEVLHFLDRSGRARVVATAADDRQLAAAVTQCEPDAVVAEPSLVADGLAAPLLALATRESVAALRAAVRAGARGFYVWPGEREGLLEGVGRCAAAGRVPAERRATVVAVHAPRGSAGATFVATHLAEAFRRAGSSCILVDADLQYADVTFGLGAAAEPTRTLADLAPVAAELAWHHLEEVLVHDAVLAPPVEALAEVDASVVRATVRVAATSADVVVVHVPPGIDDLARWCLDEADRVLEVLTLDPASFRAASRAVAIACPDGPDPRWGFVVNRAQRADLTVADVERVFGVPPVGVIPFDGAAARARAAGRLLPTRGRAGRAVAKLAAGLREAPATDRAS